MKTIYRYDTRNMVQFSNGSRSSYSAKRYGPLLEKITKQSFEEDKKIWNPYNEENNYIEILYWEQKSQEIKTILIDKEYKYLVYRYYWQLNHNGYPQTRTNGEKIYLYHLLLDYDINSGLVIDHINHDPLNNLKENLRITSQSINVLNKSHFSKNTSGTIGVSWDTSSNKWRARIMFEGEERNKYFDSKEQTVRQRKLWEKEIYSSN